MSQQTPEEQEQSEFGKGLVVCLVKFAEHAAVLRYMIGDYEQRAKRHPEQAEHFRKEDAIFLWANGASDHLYELEAPSGDDWKEVAFLVEELKQLGLNMGHGGITSGFKKDCTPANAERLFKLTKNISFLIDVKLGLLPDLGQY